MIRYTGVDWKKRAWWYIISADNEEDIFIHFNIFHFQFGLRFSLHPFSQILCHYKLSLNQIQPQATREIMSFIWTCEYMKLPLTLNLFKSLFKADFSKNKHFYTFVPINRTLLVYLELNDLKRYKNKAIWVRVPKAPKHPYWSVQEVLGSWRDQLIVLKGEPWFSILLKTYDVTVLQHWIPHAAVFR